jgi:hypothetical protein
MEMTADRTGGMGCALQAALRLGNVAFAAHLESACGWVPAWHQKPALALAAGDAVTSRRTAFGQEPTSVRV